MASINVEKTLSSDDEEITSNNNNYMLKNRNLNEVYKVALGFFNLDITNKVVADLSLNPNLKISSSSKSESEEDLKQPEKFEETRRTLRSATKKNPDFKKFFIDKSFSSSDDENIKSKIKREKVARSRIRNGRKSENNVKNKKPAKHIIKKQKVSSSGNKQTICESINYGNSDDDNIPQPELSDPPSSDVESVFDKTRLLSSSSTSDSAPVEPVKKVKRVRRRRPKPKVLDMPVLDLDDYKIHMNGKNGAKNIASKKSDAGQIVEVKSINNASQENGNNHTGNDSKLENNSNLVLPRESSSDSISETSNTSSSSSSSSKESENMLHVSHPTIDQVPKIESTTNPLFDLFGSPCERFLLGTCGNLSCSEAHKLTSVELFRQKLLETPDEKMGDVKKLLDQHHSLFVKYCESFCEICGQRNLLAILKSLIPTCEKFQMCHFFYYIIKGFKMCRGISEFYAIQLLLQKNSYSNFEACDTLLEIISYMKYQIPRFIKYVWKCAQLPGYEFSEEILDRFLDVCLEYKFPELIKFMVYYLSNTESKENLDQHKCQKFLEIYQSQQFAQPNHFTQTN